MRRGLASILLARDGPDGLAQASARTAAALEAHGFPEDALALHVERGAHDAAARVLATLAPQYARAGQSALLEAAIARLPDAVQDRSPWLSFWMGQALLGVDEESARGRFARAYDAFHAAGDDDGRLLAAASVVTAYALEYGDLRGLDAWLARYEAAGGDARLPAPGRDEATLCLAALCAGVIRASHPPGIDGEALVRRVREFVNTPSAWRTPDEAVQAARMLVDHARIFDTSESAQARVIDTRGAVERSRASPLQRGRWFISAGWAYFEDGKPDEATPLLAEAQRLVAESGSLRLAFELGMACVDAALKAGDLPDAVARLAALEALAIVAPPAQRAEHARVAARVRLLEGRIAEGLRWAEAALDTATVAGYTGGNLRQFELECIYGLAANDRLGDAIAIADRMLQGLAAAQRDAVETIRDALECLAGGLRDTSLLARTFESAARIGFVNLLARARLAAARLCHAALAAGIEPEFVRRMIAVQRLAPPPDAGAAWPWAVRVRTLGGFELTTRGERYRPAHKTQEKPLELLKMLLAGLAVDRAGVDRDWIVDRLWPDADPAAGRKSLETTLGRLRRLLRVDDAVVLSDGRLNLSPALCWTDVVPLREALRPLSAQRDRHARGQSALRESVLADLSAVVDLFRGPFLPGDDAPWILAARESLGAQLRAALTIADAVLDGGDDAHLVVAAGRAFTADPTSEDLARVLMRAHLRRGEASEALRVYRRLREMLSIVLGLEPSRETSRLRDSIHAAAPAGDAAEAARR